MRKFIFPMVVASFMLISCGAKSGGTPITPSSDSGTSITTSVDDSSVDSSTDTSDFYVIPSLHLGFYAKFADETVASGFVTSFEAYLTTKEVKITSLTTDLIGDSSTDAGGFTDLVQTYEEDPTHEYVFDALLGAKGNLTTYITNTFDVLKNDGANVEFELGAKTDRRLYTRKASENEGVAYLINYVRTLAGLPEIEPEPETSSEDSQDSSEPVDSSEETSSEETSSEETSSEETSSEESSESSESSEDTSEESSEHALHVLFYEKFADADVQSAFQTAFGAYLTAQEITISNLTYKSLTPSANGTTFASDLEAWEATVDYTIDVILGAKANLGTFITDNFSVVKNEDTTNFEYPLGSNTDRRLYVRNDTANTYGVEALSAYLHTLVAE